VVQVKVLAVSDKVEPLLDSPQVAQRFGDVDLVLGCGDLPYRYLEGLTTRLRAEVFFVRGNHALPQVYGEGGARTGPRGCYDLHRRVLNYRGVLLAGVEGSLRYSKGPYQYTQGEMWGFVWGLVPRLLLNRMLYGRFLDLFVTHAPPWGIHDKEDLPHQGVKAFRWLLRVFRPAYHIHGHVHRYTPADPARTLVGATWVINAYGHQSLTLEVPAFRREGPP